MSSLSPAVRSLTRALRSPRLSSSVRRATVLATVLVASTGVAACGDQTERTNAAYCDAVRDRLPLVATPAIATPDDVDATLAVYRDIVSRAPAAIEPEWQKLLDTLEAASAVDPADPASVAEVSDATLAVAPAAVRIQQFTQQTCSLDIGTPPPPTNPMTATLPDPGP